VLGSLWVGRVDAAPPTGERGGGRVLSKANRPAASARDPKDP